VRTRHSVHAAVIAERFIDLILFAAVRHIYQFSVISFQFSVTGTHQRPRRAIRNPQSAIRNPQSAIRNPSAFRFQNNSFSPR